MNYIDNIKKAHSLIQKAILQILNEKDFLKIENYEQWYYFLEDINKALHACENAIERQKILKNYSK